MAIFLKKNKDFILECHFLVQNNKIAYLFISETAFRILTFLICYPL